LIQNQGKWQKDTAPIYPITNLLLSPFKEECLIDVMKLADEYLNKVEIS